MPDIWRRKTVLGMGFAGMNASWQNPFYKGTVISLQLPVFLYSAEHHGKSLTDAFTGPEQGDQRKAEPLFPFGILTAIKRVRF